MRISDWSSDVCSSDLVADDVPDSGYRVAHVGYQLVVWHTVGTDVDRRDARAQPQNEAALADAIHVHGNHRGLERTSSSGDRDTCSDLQARCGRRRYRQTWRSEEHTSELQSLMRTSYAVFCLKKKKKKNM